jgi:pyridoxal phosphate enzyme (YggS family)
MLTFVKKNRKFTYDMSVKINLENIKNQLPKAVTLVAVSKTKPIEMIQEAYGAGQRVFGENKVQEMAIKYEQLPKDIYWHMIGHLQRNKVKYMAHFVSLIHAVDNLKLLVEINKQALKHNRVIACLFQLKIAKEESKFGLTKEALIELIEASHQFKNINIVGLMGMATFTTDENQVKAEFDFLKNTFDELKATVFKTKKDFDTCSMGMSGDYKLALDSGSTMIRVGSAIFGNRNYNQA